MNRTQRLEAVLRRVLHAFPHVFHGTAACAECALVVDARAALANTSPSCCEEVRRAALEEACRVVAGHFQICDATRPISMHCVETLTKDIRALSNQAPPKSATGQLHPRPDGKECAYLAEITCNKCGWVDPKYLNEKSQDRSS